MSVAWVGAGIAAYGAVSSQQAAGDAADAQVQSADKANALSKGQFDQVRADNAGYRTRGEQAGNRLQYLLGLDSGVGSGAGLTREGLRNSLLGQYTTQSKTAAPQGFTSYQPHPGMTVVGYAGGGGDANDIQPIYGYPDGYEFAGGSVVDEAGLNADIDRQMAAQAQQQQANQQNAQNDPAFGSLMRNFGKSDLDADPVYQSGLQFGLDEGEKAINNRAAQGGAFLSGATLKALTRFGNDYGSTKAGDAYNRFTNNQTNQYNRLAGVVGTGQTGTNQVSAAGQNYANQAGANITGAGNAAAAGIVGGANAINQGISSGYGAYQNNQLMNMIRNPGAGGGGGGGGYSGYGDLGGGAGNYNYGGGY